MNARARIVECRPTLPDNATTAHANTAGDFHDGYAAALEQVAEWIRAGRMPDADGLDRHARHMHDAAAARRVAHTAALNPRPGAGG